MNAMDRFRRECTAFFEALEAGAQRPLVFGDGLADGPVLMLVGEAPGEQEALEGQPFVGKAGRNLAGFLEALGLRRSEIYLTNVVKVRPTRVSPAGRVVNRPPSREEKALFTPWLMREVALVRPQALVTLGNVALQAFVHDTWARRTAPGGAPWWRRRRRPLFTLPLFALYHPASVIYNPSLKERYEQDLAALAASLRAPSDSLGDI